MVVEEEKVIRPLIERLKSKIWKVKKEGFTELMKEIENE